VDPRQLRRPFKQIFAHLQRGKALEPCRYTHGVLNLGVSASRCALDLFFPSEKKRRLSRSKLSIFRFA
ncbi:hypothetical protein MNBD_GAMMA16-285, partial [hydrothermal vent metagenome]